MIKKRKFLDGQIVLYKGKECIVVVDQDSIKDLYVTLMEGNTPRITVKVTKVQEIRCSSLCPVCAHDDLPLDEVGGYYICQSCYTRIPRYTYLRKEF